MALRINHNIVALDAQRNLANTTNSIGKVMEKLSSGFRINKASDDPAGLVISEQFRAQIAGLNKAISNSEGSISMIQTAEGSLNEINSLLISMRELAIHAANEGFNDADQLAADQAEIENAISTIDRIASNTQFGTKKLIDGTKDNIATITTANTSQLSIVKSNLSTGTHSITATKTADSTSTLNTTSLGISLNSTGTPDNLSEAIHNIDVLQASGGAEKTSSNVLLTDAWNNGLTIADGASDFATIQTGTATLSGGISFATQAGTYTVTLNYQENGEAVTGAQQLSVSLASGDSLAQVMTKFNSAIADNASLAGKVAMATVGGAGTQVRFRTTREGSQYSLRLESQSNTATNGRAGLGFGSARSSRGVSLAVLRMDAVTNDYSAGATNVTVADGTYSTMANLQSAVSTALGASAFGAVADNVDVSAYDSDTKLQFQTQDEGSAFSLQVLDAAVGAENKLQNVLGFTVDSQAISGLDAIVSFDGYSQNVDRVISDATGSYTLYNKASGVDGRGSVNITVDQAATGINTGNMLLDVKAATFAVKLDGGPSHTVTAGMNSTVWNANRSESAQVSYGLQSNGGTETISNTDQSLVFQIGANVGQTVKVAVRNLATSALGKSIAGNMFNSLANINVETVAGASDAQVIIDAAINEVTTTRGALGSFQKNTLESNLRNLRVASQNLTSSESNIRDTDMAAAMSEFVKNQILMQAGVSMLAQGNQLPQVVLSLFG